MATLPSIEIVTRSKAIVTIDDHSQPVTDLLGAGDANTKLRKNSGHGFRTFGLSMLPHRLGGIGNVCGFASPGCIAACLNSTGLGSVFSSIQFGRLCRRMLWHNSRNWFLDRLTVEIDREQRKAQADKLRLAIRLNVLSDIPWERYSIIDNFPNVEFYDYTKNPNRVGLVRPNYWVTFSRSEKNQGVAVDLLRRRKNAAVVFHNPGRGFVGNRSGLQRLPKQWEGFDVINGDETDLRFLDTRGRSRGGKVIGLKLKASSTAKRQGAIDSGFSVGYSPC